MTIEYPRKSTYKAFGTLYKDLLLSSLKPRHSGGPHKRSVGLLSVYWSQHAYTVHLRYHADLSLTPSSGLSKPLYIYLPFVWGFGLWGSLPSLFFYPWPSYHNLSILLPQSLQAPLPPLAPLLHCQLQSSWRSLWLVSYASE